MAYNKDTDFQDIQSDVLTTDSSTNTLISAAKRLQTNSKVVTKAINELVQKIGTSVEQVTTVGIKLASVQDKISEIENNINSGELSGSSSLNLVIQNDELHADADGQYVFSLSKTPIDKNNILFYINGLKYNREDYDYDESSNTITWKNINKMNILQSYYISIVYMTTMDESQEV